MINCIQLFIKQGIWEYNAVLEKITTQLMLMYIVY